MNKAIGVILCGFCIVSCGPPPPNINGKWVEQNPRTIADAYQVMAERKYVNGFTDAFPGATLEFKLGGEVEITSIQNGVGVRFFGTTVLG